MKTTCN